MPIMNLITESFKIIRSVNFCCNKLRSQTLTFLYARCVLHICFIVQPDDVLFIMLKHVDVDTKNTSICCVRRIYLLVFKSLSGTG
jgi:hypothetical protein